MLIMAMLPIQALAMDSVTVEVSFTVENTPGTVVIEAVGGAPVPAQTEMSDVLEGTFDLTFNEPGNYAYKVYQKQGLDDYTAYYKTYDDTVYDVVVSVFWNEQNELYGVVTASIPGDSYKPGEIVFVNESEEADLTIRKAQALGTGAPTTDKIDVDDGDEITYFITVSNDTEASVYDVAVTDEIPSGLKLKAGSISNGGSEENGVVSWYLGIMGPGDSATVSFTTTVTVADKDSKEEWVNIASGNFVNQTGRVSISTGGAVGLSVNRAGTGMTAVALSANSNRMGAVSLSSNAARRIATDPQVIKLNTNDVKAVYTPPVKMPQTGDNGNIGLWLALGEASLAGVIFLIVTRRKERSEG